MDCFLAQTRHLWEGYQGGWGWVQDTLLLWQVKEKVKTAQYKKHYLHFVTFPKQENGNLFLSLASFQGTFNGPACKHEEKEG